MTSHDQPPHQDDDSAGGSRHADVLSIGVLRGTPTPEELAALSAVLEDAYAREAAGAVAGEASGMSAWAVSQRALRSPLRRELGWTRSTQ